MIKDDINDIYALPENLFNGDMDLTDKEFRVLVALYFMSEGRPKLKKSHVQISACVNGASTETIRKATKGLRDKGLIDYHRTKRNFGRLYVNEYELLHPMRARLTKELEAKKAVNRPYIKTGWQV